MSGEVVNLRFAGRESVTVYVLIMSTGRDSKPETFMALTLWVYFPSICAFPDSFSSSNLTLQLCHTPHWLPWRKSPPGLQGTRAYCLWLLYLDENMICWKGSTCFFLSLLPFAGIAFFFFRHMNIDINRASFPSSFQEFDCARVRIKLAWCFVAINSTVAACQRGGRRGGTNFPPLPHALARLIITSYYQGSSITRTVAVRTGNFITAGETMQGVLTSVRGPMIAFVSYRCDFLSLQSKSQLFLTVRISVSKVPLLNTSYFCICYQLEVE